ncbi:MAG: geranylgeranylglyceryl/heptaprenylglyceryl phosphate synthase, partial [Crocinitomicaceae bacterium]
MPKNKDKITLYDKINSCKGEIAVLIDPEKTFGSTEIEMLVNKINESFISFIFIGGSTLKKINLDPIIKKIKKISSLPIIIFPGNHTQISSYADGVFYLSLLTSRNPQFLIEEQIKSTSKIIKSNI